MAKKAVVLLADGFEEVEALTPVDYLRRAGVEVTTAAAGEGKAVSGSHGVTVVADARLAELAAGAAWDAVVCPGGLPGATNLAASGETATLLRETAAAGGLVCAICAAPAVVLAPLGLLAGKAFTCYPGMEQGVSGARHSPGKVVRDGAVITSQGAGTAGLFAIAVISALLGDEAGKAVAEKVCL